jgi:hypothetical protein
LAALLERRLKNKALLSLGFDCGGAVASADESTQIKIVTDPAYAKGTVDALTAVRTVCFSSFSGLWAGHAHRNKSLTFLASKCPLISLRAFCMPLKYNKSH